MRLVRWLAGLALVGLLVVAVAVVGVLGWITARALPAVRGELVVAGLDAPVEVTRDVAGIAHITADTPHDLFFAQGYVHAQERLWQMEVLRHIGAGRLSELFGSSQLDTDRFIRTLGWRQAAERDLAALPPDILEVVESYADGINAFIGGNRGSLGLTFVVAGLTSGRGGGLDGYAPEPWTPLDVATFQKVQAWSLGGNLGQEIFRVLADARLGDPARTDELFPGYPAGAPVTVPSDATTGDAATVVVGGPGGSELTADEAAALGDVGRLAGTLTALDRAAAPGTLVGDRGIGSNDWVVGPARSATGHALLANDPHLSLPMPSVWYMNGLHCRAVSEACPFDVAGVSFPGAPAVILGHNARIAWGVTNVDPDVQDLFVERVDPDDPTRYLTEDGSEPFITRTETIRVAGGDPLTMTVRETRHGPVLNDVDEDLAELPDLYALRWAATAEVDRTLEAFIRLDAAADWDDFRAALALYGAPSQNFVYADVDGHIGYQLPGHLPIRAGDARGDRPREGWTGDQEWTGWIPFEELPWLYDPPGDRIATANNAPVDDAYPYHLGDDWDPGDRAARIIERLDALGPGAATTGDLAAIQLDDRLPRADRIAQHLLAATPGTEDGRLLQRRIAAWDHHCDAASLGCAAYAAVELRAIRGLLDDELGLDLARDFVGSSASQAAFESLLGRPDDPWWDDTATPETERAPDMLARALDEAGAELRATLGPPSRWAWYRLHTVTFGESTLGSSGIGPLEWYLSQGPYPVGGAAGAVNNTAYDLSRTYPDPDDPSSVGVGIDRAFEVAYGPSYRLVVDLGDLDGARIVNSTGNGGDPFGPHYGDLIDDWRTGRTVPLPFSPEAIAREAASTLVLRP